MSTAIQSIKLTGEAPIIQVDMSSRLVVGETLLTVATVMSVFSGTDANPSALLSGAPTILNSVVSQKVVSGLPGVIYLLSISVRTSRGQILIDEVKLAILTSPAVAPP